MLTCVNPEVTFKLNSVRHRGAAVALKWLFATIRNFGGTPPPEDKTRQEIRTLDIGLVGDKKQYFNKYANGKKISRAAGGVEIQSKSCVTVKHSAFGANSWEVFCEGILLEKKTRSFLKASIYLGKMSYKHFIAYLHFSFGPDS